MEAFKQFLGGTFGIITAIAVCIICSVLACVISSGVLVLIVPTPTP